MTRRARWALALAALPFTGIAPRPTEAQRTSGAPASACATAATTRACYERGLDLARQWADSAKRGSASAADFQRRSVVTLRDACGRGEAEACYLAGRIVATPTDVAASDATLQAGLVVADSLFRLGCYAPHFSAAACNSLADSYAYGLGAPVDADTALVLFERACRGGNPTGCFRYGARLPDHPELGPGRLALEVSMNADACRDGSLGGCLNKAVRIYRRLRLLPPAERNTPEARAEGAEMMRAYRASCDPARGRWLLLACNNIGAAFLDGTGIAVNVDSAKAYYLLACEGPSIPSDSARDAPRGDGLACSNYGERLLEGAHPDTATALRYIRWGCTLFSERACATLAEVGFAVFPDSAHLWLLRAATACNEKGWEGCQRAGLLLLARPFEDQARALRYFARGCGVGDEWSCYQAGLVSGRRLGDERAAAKFHRRGCELGEGYACAELGALLRSRALPREARIYYARAATILDGACGRRDATKVCWDGVRFARLGRMPAEEGRMHARACVLSADYCKKKADFDPPLQDAP